VATETKSKELIRPMPLDWWLRKPAYTQFMLRDATSIVIAAYCVFLLVLLYRANQGPESFEAFYKSLQSPVSILLHLIALVAATYHTVTFFGLVPHVLVMFRGEERVPDAVILGAHYALWAIVSLTLILIALMV
jgi:fumarate reductase subunit C